MFSLAKDDKVTIVIPAEGEHETVLLDETPIDIVYEDEHVLVVNKPAGVSSIPAQYHPNGTMANRVKAYYKKTRLRKPSNPCGDATRSGYIWFDAFCKAWICARKIRYATS